MHQQTPLAINCDTVIDTWIKSLDNYNLSQLTAKPSPTSWSVGQLYMHLVQATGYFIKQIHACTTSNDNLEAESYPEARSMFANNDFPDMLLDGPPSNATTPQPTSKEQLIDGLKRVKDEIKKSELQIAQTPFKGKAKHFALGYFTAQEWLQFTEMHFRHHLRQKKRLDEFLHSNNIH